MSAKKPPAVDLELIRKLYAILTPEEAAKGYPFRKENPLHRLYYHEIAPPEKITAKMRKLEEWMQSDEFAELHPITRATKAHFRLLNTYPWTKNSGKVARLLMNFILIRHGYLPAVIHAIERQRYYEVLRFENDGLLNLIVESLENSIETTSKFLDELNGLRSSAVSATYGRRTADDPAAGAPGLRSVLETQRYTPVRCSARLHHCRRAVAYGAGRPIAWPPGLRPVLEYAEVHSGPVLGPTSPATRLVGRRSLVVIRQRE